MISPYVTEGEEQFRDQAVFIIGRGTEENIVQVWKMFLPRCIIG